MSDNAEITSGKMNIPEMTETILVDVRKEDVPKDKSLIMPLAELTTLGAGVSSLLPMFNTITQTTQISTGGLYQLANQGVGDVLKIAKDGNFWGAFNTADGGSKFVKLKGADSVSATSTVALKANPAMMMMAVALFVIEKEVEGIKNMQKEILSFLQIEKESEIEADVITLTDIVTKYKDNWDNERYIASNHKMVCDIQRTARKNMIAYRKLLSERLKSKQFLVMPDKMNTILTEMLKEFKYYRLSLYTFSVSSLAEIILSGNFKTENINSAINEIRSNSDEYRDLFAKCSVYLEKLSKGSVETNVLKGIGTASNAMGKLIGNIPKVKEGQVDEFLIESGQKIKGSAQKVSKEIIGSFSEVSNPNTASFIGKLEDMDMIYNKTTAICFDKDNLYLVVG